MTPPADRRPPRRGRSRTDAKGRGAAAPPARPDPGRASEEPAGRPLQRHAVLAVALVWALAFAPQLFAGRAYTFGDVSAIRAYGEFSADAWRQTRQRALWNPYVFGGIPGAASLQDTRPQWLPDPLLDAFDALHRAPGVTPLLIPILVHLAGALSAAALAGALWGAGAPGQAWAGVAWLLLPNLIVPFAFGHDAQLMAASLMPAALLSVCRAFEARGLARRVAAALGVALASAAVLMAAHPQTAVFVAIAAAALTAERATARRPAGGATPVGAAARGAASTLRRAAPGLAVVAAGAALGAAMSAAVWWPALLYNTHTVRGAGGGLPLDEVARWSASFADLLSLGWPWAAGFGGATYWGGLLANDFPQYAGVAVMAFAVATLASRAPGRRAAWTLAGLGLLGLALALGLRAGAPYRWLHAHVPLMSSFRVAINALILAQLAAVLLSARGVEGLRARAERDGGAALLRIAGACAAAGLAIAALALVPPIARGFADLVASARSGMDADTALRGARSAAWDLALRAVVLAAALGALARLARRRADSSPPPATGGPVVLRVGAWPAAALVALLALDLGSVAMPFAWRATGTLGGIEQPAAPAIARLAAADPRHRALAADRARFFSSDWIRWRARSISGVHPAVPRAWNELRESGALGLPPVARALAVRWVSGLPPDTARWTPAAGTGADAVGELRGALPRAFAVANVEHAAGDAASVERLADPSFDPARTAIARDARAAGRYADPSGVRIEWRADEPDRLALEVTSPAPAFVVVADTWLPGWSATVDGTAAEIHRVDHLLRGIAVPAGRRRLELRYVSEGWAAAAPASRLAWGAWLVAASVVGLFSRWRPKDGAIP